MIYKSYESKSKITRIAAAGSLTFLLCELSFFPLDALNLNQKLHLSNISTLNMLKMNLKLYGPYGVYRGFTTSFYSSTTAGFAFFAIYKGLKQNLKEKFKPKN